MKVVLLYTMKGCPFCDMIKDELNELKIFFLERDIDDYSEEYDEFTQAVGNEYVPSFMLMTLNDNDETTNYKLCAPERDFDEISEGVNIIKNYLSE